MDNYTEIKNKIKNGKQKSLRDFCLKNFTNKDKDFLKKYKMQKSIEDIFKELDKK